MSDPPLPSGGKTCYLSRSRGWLTERSTKAVPSEGNLLAVALGRPVWTAGTAWESLFHRPMPRGLSSAFWKAMVRVRLDEIDVAHLQAAARSLGVRIEWRP
ncbi:MAG: hypothetical protein ACYCPN_06285 [Thermoplasmata archaeon]